MFVDFSKAFNYVNHTFLFHKMIQKDINGKIFNSIYKLYSNPMSCVQVNGELTDWFDINNGVRQGDSLSPVLFSVFINDLADRVREADLGVKVGGENIPMSLYADDVVFLASSHNESQAQLNISHDWGTKWSMKVNVSKTQVMHIRNPQRPRCKD